MVHLDREVRSERELLEVGSAWATVVTTDGSLSEIGINENGGGYPFATVAVTGAFTPGPAPEITIDTAAALEAAFLSGADRVDLYLSFPTDVQYAFDSAGHSNEDRRFEFTEGNPPLVGTILLSPEEHTVAPLLTALLLHLLPISAFALTVFAAIRRRPVLGYAAGTAALVLSLSIGSKLEVSSRADEFIVSGQSAQFGSFVWTFYLLTTLMVWCLMVPLWVVLSIRSENGPVVFKAPPGWPEVPDGWLPWPGWEPDEQWPAAPKRWRFLARVSTRDAHPSHSRADWVRARAWARRRSRQGRAGSAAKRTLLKRWG